MAIPSEKDVQTAMRAMLTVLRCDKCAAHASGMPIVNDWLSICVHGKLCDEHKLKSASELAAMGSSTSLNEE